MSDLFKNKVGRKATSDYPLLDNLSNLMKTLKTDSAQQGGRLAAPAAAKAALSMEAITEDAFAEMQSAVKCLSTAMESYITDAQLGNKVTGFQHDAAVAGAMMAGDIFAAKSMPVRRAQPAMENVEYVNVTGADMFYDHPAKVAMEAYDERENRNATTYTTAYNMMASRQGPFAEMFFPTVVVTPDQVGFTVTLRITSVLSDVKRDISGVATNFNKINIIQAVIDPDIFKPDQTKIVPVVRDESEARFVDPALVAPYTVLVDTEEVTTAPLKMGVKLGLIDISQNEALIKTGILDITDAVDTSVTLDNLYLTLTGTISSVVHTETFKFKTAKLPSAVWNYAPQGNYRQMLLAFTSDSMLLTKDTKTVGGATSALLAVLGTAQARLSFNVSGSINLETSETRVWADDVNLDVLLDETNQKLALTSGSGLAAANLFAAGKLIGYDLGAQRTNSNRRQRGQLLDTTFYNQIYTVPLRSPLSIPRPQTNGDENDASDLASLITATHIRINNAAIDTLLEAADFLNEYIREQDTYATAPAILGLARWLVTPHFRRLELDVREVIQSLDSSSRFEDIQQAIIGVLRDLVFNAYRDTGWQAAADALAGGNGGKPVVLIGTDPVIARYISINGDTRLLGVEDFTTRLETTLNKRMKGKIVISFGQEGKEGVPNPMHFGNHAWKPELTLVLPVHRNGANNKELMVTPSFLHIVNLPIMIVIDVVGITEVATGKVALPVDGVLTVTGEVITHEGTPAP